ncbi:MAG TPA: hypothetical protein PK347_07170 [Burkholderiaceae bacterium]|nr:hypothetical protein [Burkholderiaceae bacterium]
MTDTGNSGFGKFVPGFEFLQNLARQATGGLAQGMQPAAPQVPNLGNWVAPTFSVEDLDKRINELKTVQFWLDQNSRALGATIQALEVQKMTLVTLKGMNVSMGDVAETLKVKTADVMASMASMAAMGNKPADGPADPATPASEPVGSAGKAGGTQFAGLEIPPRHAPAAAPAEPPVPPAAPETQAAAPSPSPAPAAAPVVDPMQWWGALTQQFQTIAAQAMQELPGQTAVEASKHMATALASEAVKTATEMTAGVARSLAPKSPVEKPPAKTSKTSKTAKPTQATGGAGVARAGDKPAVKRSTSAGGNKASVKAASAKAAKPDSAATAPAARGVRKQAGKATAPSRKVARGQ